MKTAFKKGDRVVYGTNGLCRIDDIKEMQITSSMPLCTYYILRPDGSSNATLYVPIDNEALCARMRSVFTKKEIDEMLAGAKDRVIEWTDDKNLRLANFRDILSHGIHEEMLLMIRCLYLRKREISENHKRLSGVDETTLQSAERLVNEEFSFSLGIPEEAVGEYIRRALDITAD